MSADTQQHHSVPLARSSSFFGAIKNIVAAPFAWFAGSEDEFEETKGKRRRFPVSSEDVHMEDESVPSRAKRIRVNSPDRDPAPYLDPPRSAFTQPRPGRSKSEAARDVTRSPRKTLRDISMSPRHIRVRSSLTPQPSGTGFGPVVPPRKERGSHGPPPLTSLMSNPMFVKPPPAAQKQPTPEAPKTLTLGTLVDSHRTARLPARQSSILFGTGSMTDVSAPGHLWPVNKAEIALHELEVYKTPLLPTRLKGATAIPDMFLHKEKKHITLMTDDRPVKPRLGTKSKGKEKGKKKDKDKEAVNGTKPYAGEGGMKKWLARRKKEEEEAKEKERADAMEDERVEEARQFKEAEAEKKREELKVPPPSQTPVFEPRTSREGPLSSSLRIGRMRVGRNHIERPLSRRPKFSAAFDDEDEDMEESRVAEHKALEEAAKKAPVFELPSGFTFANEAAITHDLTNAKEPPITSLPFSLTKPSIPAPAPAPLATEVTKVAPTTTSSTPALVLPTISLVPPTPETAKVSSVTSTRPAVTLLTNTTSTPSGIPNFFASSSVFAKSVTATTIPSSSLPIPAEDQPKTAESLVPNAQKLADSTPSSSAVPLQHISALVTPTPDSVATPAPSKEGEKPPVVPSLALPFTFGAQTKTTESVPALISTTGPVNATSSISFGSPAPLAPTVPATEVGAPKSAFPFSQPVPSAAPAPTTPAATMPSTDTSKPLFGTPPPSTPFSFAPRPSTAPAEGKSPFSFGTPTAKKPAENFTFGSPAPSTTAPVAPVAFSFGTAPSGTTGTDVSTKPFSFGTTTTTTRPATPPKAEQEVTMDESPARDMVLNGTEKAPERPTLNFSSFNTPSGSALFAQSPATTTAPFSFGAQSGTTNPFAKEEKKEPKPGVTFSGFGQTGPSGFSFNQKPPESSATTAPSPFQFSQPSPSAAPPSPFAFGPGSATTNPFGQSSTASAPSSPSTFSRPSTFAFGTSGTSTTTQPAASPFSFGVGSQPASPAAGSTALPSGTAGGATPFAFGTGTTPAAGPTVGFGAAASGAAAGSLFTMGSAPPPAESAGGRRVIKGLPRRGVRR